LDEAQEALRHRKSQVERQANELGIARDLMTEQNDELANLRQQHTQLQGSHTQLQTEKTAVDDELETAVREINTLRDRIHSLEVAHKASLMHTAEQEESLIRWQELAEITEKKAADLEGELQKVKLQIEENSSIIEMQREQRHAAEKELEKTLDELTLLREQSKDPLAKVAQLKEAEARITSLEAELADAEHAHFERVLWYKAELETSQAAATAAQQQADEQTEMLTGLEASVHAQQETVTELQTAVAETEATLEANEIELKHILNQTNAQGEHLAEIQARLVERELQLKQAIAQLTQARTMIEKQNQAIKQIQQKAGERIQALQTQLGKR
jgi:chromosome segregation ATPase